MTKKYTDKEKKRSAEYHLTPEMQAGRVAIEFFGMAEGMEKYVFDEYNVSSNYMNKVTNVVLEGNLTDLERMLTTQSLLLNNVFNDMLFCAGRNKNEHLKAMQVYMNLAMKAQAQCRCTVEAINEIKNPKSITITKQANVAGQQVVNNGVINTGESSRGEKKEASESNEVNKIGVINHATVDAGIKTSTKGKNNADKTLAEVNRSKDKRG